MAPPGHLIHAAAQKQMRQSKPALHALTSIASSFDLNKQ
jgi:hypothetical protein